MADVSANTPIFSRGSTVLDYWLVHAEGLIVQPLGARVEEVVVVPPVGHAKSLIIRSRRTRRLREIPADSIAAVEPSSGHLLLDVSETQARRPIPRPSPERIEAARATAVRGADVVHGHAVGAARWTHAGTRSTLAWLRPRALVVATTSAKHGRLAAARTAQGVAWLAPRLAAGARAAAVTGARRLLATAVTLARGLAWTARELERAAASGAERGRASLEARRARRQRMLDE